ncbi:MAG: NCS2 family nucleobase:cation symporter [Propionibacteriaceae bacterium]|jgi:uracil-xanthine permease|nr:NCS2 family nucleobase:cation symporter [Propionibacteriaceae bacterium]
MAIWTLHTDDAASDIVAPEERLTWPRTIGMGLQHVVAMFGATFLVPAITGFPPSTTLFFSAIGTMTFLLITGNRLPSYLGSSFAFLSPIGAAKIMENGGGYGAALFGVLCTGVILALVGVAVHFLGAGWLNKAMPPVVTGSIVALIGLNLAGSAWNNFSAQKGTAAITVVVILLVTVLFKGMIGRLSILIGVLAGYAAAYFQGQLDFTAVRKAAWVGLPEFQAPEINFSVVLMFVPVVFALIAENVGHVKSVALMTGRNYDKMMGRALLADGVATVLAGAGGGSGTTTYAENIGVMAATKVYSTAVYWVAGFVALALSLIPKFGAAINTIPAGVLGGAGTVLYGMIGMLGARIWVENHIDFGKSVNLMTAAVALIAGIANFTFYPTENIELGGIAVGSFGAIIIFHVMNALAKWRGTGAVSAEPDTATELESAHE